MFTKDPKTFIEKYVESVEKNAALIKKYPFLRPIDCEGNVLKDFDFSFTEIDVLPEGWHKIMHDLCADLIACFSKIGVDPYDFRIEELKEKFGSIALYYSINGESLEKEKEEKYNAIDEVIQKYKEISERTCCKCGSKATLMSTGWICPFCNECAEKVKAENGRNFVELKKRANA